MNLRHEFVVPVPLDQVWGVLLDVPRVASALPGAHVERGDDGEYRGRMNVKIGPVSAEYDGTARVDDIDEDDHTATFHLQGSGRQGSASATITNHLEAVEGGTLVVVETDLRVTGRAAAFGRGLMEDVSGRMLAEFARRLEAEIVAPHSTAPPASGDRKDDDGEELDLGPSAWQPLLRRYAVPALLVLVLLLLLRRPRVIVIREG